MLILIPNKALSTVCRDNALKFFSFAKNCKSVTITARVDGKDFKFEGDWLKYAQITKREPETLPPTEQE